MNPDFDIKITCREGSESDNGTYPEELSCCGYVLLTFNKDDGEIIMHGKINPQVAGKHLAKAHPEVAEKLIMGLAQGACDDEDNK